jgi:hypothetical protein
MCSTFMFDMLKQVLIVLQSAPRSEALGPIGFLANFFCVSWSFLQFTENLKGSIQ